MFVLKGVSFQKCSLRNRFCLKFRYIPNMGQEGELFCKLKLLDQIDV